MPLVHIVVKNADLRREVSTFVRLLGPEYIGVFSPLHSLFEKRVKQSDFVIISNENIASEEEVKLRESGLKWISIGKDKSEAYLALKCKASEYILWPSDRHILKSILLKSSVDVADPLITSDTEKEIPFMLIKGNTEQFQMGHIILIEALGDISYIYLINGDNMVRRVASNESLKVIEKRLPERSFFRVHRKFFVNMQYIRPFGDYPKNHVRLELIDMDIPLARRRKLDFVNWYRGK